MFCYVDDALRGMTRRRRGCYWQYFDAKGKRISARDEIRRPNGIAPEPVAQVLGNTRAIHRKSHVHPALIKAANNRHGGTDLPCPRPTRYLPASERGLIVFLERDAARTTMTKAA